jgi:NAD/NADP transhydrogenase alpha subunit
VWLGVAAVVLASIYAFVGFLVTLRMLEMFKRKEPGTKPPAKR